MSKTLENNLTELAKADVEGLMRAQISYGNSWKRRGGVGAFMMLARKWDRISNQCKKVGWDVFKAIEADPSDAGILDDIRDLRRYLLLVHEEMQRNGYKDPGSLD